jgi:hypothetical protein
MHPQRSNLGHLPFFPRRLLLRTLTLALPLPLTLTLTLMTLMMTSNPHPRIRRRPRLDPKHPLQHSNGRLLEQARIAAHRKVPVVGRGLEIQHGPEHGLAGAVVR